jgi:AraC family transcriptional regulator
MSGLRVRTAQKRLMAERFNVPPGGGAFVLPRLAVGLFLTDQPGHRIAVGSDRRKPVPLVAGEGWILPAGASGICEYDAALSYLKLELPDVLLVDVGFDRARDAGPIVGRIDPLLAELARQAVSTAAEPASLYRETMELALAAHLAHLLSPRTDGAATIDDRRLKRAVSYIHDNIAEDLSLDEMAAEAAISRFHFVRSFRKAFGISPYQYVIHQRMERAKILLKMTRLPVAEVAARVGYDDISRFGRHFRRHAGVTPAAFRMD